MSGSNLRNKEDFNIFSKKRGLKKFLGSPKRTLKFFSHSQKSTTLKRNPNSTRHCSPSPSLQPHNVQTGEKGKPISGKLYKQPKLLWNIQREHHMKFLCVEEIEDKAADRMITLDATQCTDHPSSFCPPAPDPFLQLAEWTSERYSSHGIAVSATLRPACSKACSRTLPISRPTHGTKTSLNGR